MVKGNSPVANGDGNDSVENLQKRLRDTQAALTLAQQRLAAGVRDGFGGGSSGGFGGSGAVPSSAGLSAGSHDLGSRLLAEFGTDDSALDEQSPRYRELVSRFGRAGVEALATSKFSHQLVSATGIDARVQALEAALEKSQSELSQAQNLANTALNEARLAGDPDLRALQALQWELHDSVKDGSAGLWPDVLQWRRAYEAGLSAHAQQLAVANAQATGIDSSAPPAASQGGSQPRYADEFDAAVAETRARFAGQQQTAA